MSCRGISTWWSAIPAWPGEAFADILVEPVREMPGWIARCFGRAFQGALIEWLSEVDPQIDSSGPHEQGPLAESALEIVVWEGHKIWCPPLPLQLAVAERRGRLEDAHRIKRFQQLAGED